METGDLQVTEKTRYKTKIAGHDYTIIGTETKEHMDLTTELVNEQIEQIKQLAPGTTIEQAAILSAINATSDRLKSQEELLTLKKEIILLKREVHKSKELEEELHYLQKLEEEHQTIEKQLPKHYQAQKQQNRQAKASIHQAQEKE